MKTELKKDPHQIVELRQYTLHPHKRDALIELFDKEFVKGQEAVGITVLGQFRDVDNADLFVWLRGFSDMQQRLESLTAFYTGAVWQAHRNAANATMIDSDNVLLLRPAWSGAGLPFNAGERALPDAEGAAKGVLSAADAARGLLVASIFYLKAPATAELLRFCQEAMSQALTNGGAQLLAWYVSDASSNTFAALPVREGEHVLVGLALFPDESVVQAFKQSGVWSRTTSPMLAQWCRADAPSQAHNLLPTAGSALHA